MASKKWSTPQLIVLGRGMPEESVLDYCKHPDVAIGPDNTGDCQLGGSSNAACKPENNKS